MTAPPGWRVRLLRPRGVAGHWIEWHMPAARADAGVGPGRNLVGFSVVVPGGDPAYLEADYIVGGVRGGALRLLDISPPELSLSAAAARPAPDAAAFRIMARVTDDRDPQPRVKLESIERVRPGPGAQAAWVATYSAADASGNRTAARARVALPPRQEDDGREAVLAPRRACCGWR